MFIKLFINLFSRNWNREIRWWITMGCWILCDRWAWWTRVSRPVVFYAPSSYSQSEWFAAFCRWRNAAIAAVKNFSGWSSSWPTHKLPSWSYQPVTSPMRIHVYIIQGCYLIAIICNDNYQLLIKAYILQSDSISIKDMVGQTGASFSWIQAYWNDLAKLNFQWIFLRYSAIQNSFKI